MYDILSTYINKKTGGRNMTFTSEAEIIGRQQKKPALW
ncbi:Uncharacterized protein dnm_034640 [Desulfonema magnum]|uniref:Uncharacterized protein n=1 Tax=Desulfonema magnum TaxID=45655 RepID=A0A975BLV4_9BACT|nr:Uncharacterized protein dnm_034640 [Desulfonema magnum]